MFFRTFHTSQAFTVFFFVALNLQIQRVFQPSPLCKVLHNMMNYLGFRAREKYTHTYLLHLDIMSLFSSFPLKRP